MQMNVQTWGYKGRTSSAFRYYRSGSAQENESVPVVKNVNIRE